MDLERGAEIVFSQLLAKLPGDRGASPASETSCPPLVICDIEPFDDHPGSPRCFTRSRVGLYEVVVGPVCSRAFTCGSTRLGVDHDSRHEVLS